MEYVDPSWDARILADAERIKADPQRYAKAKAAAAKIHTEDSERLNAMASVAGVSGTDRKANSAILNGRGQITPVIKLSRPVGRGK